MTTQWPSGTLTNVVTTVPASFGAAIAWCGASPRCAREPTLVLRPDPRLLRSLLPRRRLLQPFVKCVFVLVAPRSRAGIRNLSACVLGCCGSATPTEPRQEPDQQRQKQFPHPPARTGTSAGP